MSLSSLRRRPRLKHLALLVGSGSALAIAACSGPSFSPCASGSCEPGGGGEAGRTEPTPPVAGNAGDTAHAGAGGDGGGSGGRDDGGGAGKVTGGAPVSGHGGESAGAAGADAGAGGEAGAPSVSCVEDEECSNDDPTDGNELCVDHRCEPGNAPPFVVSVSPDRGALEQAPNAAIELKFSEKLDPDSLTSETLVVEAGGARVAGDIAQSGLVATFTPRARFPLRGLVTVKVADTVTDLAGAKMLDDFSSGFWIRDGEWTEPMPVDSVAPARTGRHLPIDAGGNVLVTFVRSGMTANDRRAFSRFYHPAIGELSAFVEHSESATPAAASITGALNPDGVGSVIWRQSALRAYGCYSREYRDRQWTVAPAPRSFEALGVATAVSPTADAHFATGQASMNLTRCTPDGTCSGSAATPNDGMEVFPSLAFDAQGNAVAAWRREPTAEEPGGIVTAHYSAEEQAWKPGALLTNRNQAEVPAGSQPALAVAPDGRALVVWVEQGPLDPGSSSTVAPRLLLTSHYTPESGWSEPFPLSSNLGDIGHFSPAVTFDGEGAIVAWVAIDNGTHIYTLRPGSGLEFAERRDEGGSFVRKVMPQIASDGAGDVILTWLEGNGSTHRLAYQRRIDGIWSSTEYLGEFVNPRVEDATLDPAVQLGVGVTGVAAVLWEQRNASGTLEALSLSVFE